MQDQQNNSNHYESEEEWISIGEAAEFLNVSRDTLRRWGKKGKIKTYRTPTNRRCYKKSELSQLFTSARGQTIARPASSVANIVKAEQTSQTTETVPPMHTYASEPIQDIAYNNNQDASQLLSNANYQQAMPRGVSVETEKLINDLKNQNEEPLPNTQVVEKVENTQPRDDVEIVQITPQAVNYQKPTQNPDTSPDDNNQRKENRSINVLKIVILVISVFLILAGIAIVGLVFLYPSEGSATILSPV